MEQPGLEIPTNRGPGKAYQAKAHLGSKALDGRGSDPRSPLPRGALDPEFRRPRPT